MQYFSLQVTSLFWLIMFYSVFNTLPYSSRTLCQGVSTLVLRLFMHLHMIWKGAYQGVCWGHGFFVHEKITCDFWQIRCDGYVWNALTFFMANDTSAVVPELYDLLTSVFAAKSSRCSSGSIICRGAIIPAETRVLGYAFYALLYTVEILYGGWLNNSQWLTNNLV